MKNVKTDQDKIFFGFFAFASRHLDREFLPALNTGTGSPVCVAKHDLDKLPARWVVHRTRIFGWMDGWRDWVESCVIQYSVKHGCGNLVLVAFGVCQRMGGRFSWSWLRNKLAAGKKVCVLGSVQVGTVQSA
jgi:hypothetical protein